MLILPKSLAEGAEGCPSLSILQSFEPCSKRLWSPLPHVQKMYYWYSEASLAGRTRRNWLMQSVVRSLLLGFLGGYKTAHQMFGSAEGVRKFGNPNMWEFFPFKDHRHIRMMWWTNMRWKVGQIQDGTPVHRLIICGIIDRGTESEYETQTHSDHPPNVSPAFQFPPLLISSRCNQNLSEAGGAIDFHGKC